VRNNENKMTERHFNTNSDLSAAITGAFASLTP
jgi:hypothetical protein